MTRDNNTSKKGFSGLSSLASEVGDIDRQINHKPKAAANPSTPKQQPQPQRDEALSESEGKAVSSSPSIETVNSDGGGAGGKWFLGLVGVIIVVWFLNNGGQNRKKSSHTSPSSSQSYSYPQSVSTPAVQPPSTIQSTGLQYTKPSVGTNNVLSVPEIRWCIRESIRLEAMRDVINANTGIDDFNRLVDDYNSRCGNYRYRQNSHSQAVSDVEAYRSQIVAEAVHEARQLGRRSPSTHDDLKKPSAKHTREAQQLLTDLGYDPGPVDGGYGRRTADAVKAFQRDVGITQDGWIDEDLLSTLRRAKTAYKPPVYQPEPQSRTSLQPRSSTPPATAAKPKTLSYEEQSKYDTSQRLRRLGYDVDWRTNSLTDMLDAESRIGTANRLARLGHKVDWRTSSLTDMLDAETRIGTANRLARLGYKVDWQTISLTDMLDAESRIGAANRLKRKGISVDWRSYSLTQLLNMEYGQN
ncbi:peptidoglycan-binding protein [Nitratidesulfovibrio liaohensis]|uniref:Peptidoglycan-binding protein n=1 Tax=Nitratidesulfovibrio liaohensis TaxID=2604158 RepID=A0ABY9R183_9BACT|nr:peptidoglycan-binding protein [Nitratidesulfovibrio liaohensis]WMW64529.1 peptidoglycan-binding protein [Nitratidesulfovibrio liaohensis]